MAEGTRPRITAAAVAHNRIQLEPAEDQRRRVAYLESYNNRGDLWITDPGSGWPRQVTAGPGTKGAGSYRGGFFCWFPDGTELVFVGVDDQLWLIPDIGGPTTRLTDLPGRCSAPAVSPDGQRLALVYTTSTRTDVVVAPVGAKPSQESDLVVLNRSDFAFDPEWSSDGSLIAWQEWDVPSMPWDPGRLVVGRADGSGHRVVDGGGYAVGQPRFSPDGRWLAYLCERTGWLNLWIADSATWTTRHLVDEPAEHGSPAWGPRVRSFAWSPESDRLLFVRNHVGREVLARVSLDGGMVERVGVLQGTIGDLSWRHQPLMVVAASSVPHALVALDDEGTPGVIADDGLALWDGVVLAKSEPVTFPADDGVEIHGLLWRSPNDGPRPLLLYCHGGPNGQVKDDWYPSFQYWVDRGYAVLAVNYRGSTGYGREYRDGLLGRWGELDVADSAAAVRWAFKEGIAEPGRAVAWGGSAGGFLVLMLLAHFGELFRGGVNLFGVTDLEHLASHTHRFEAHYLDLLVGPWPEYRERYRERSPLQLVDQIERPVLILQGEDDEAVPLAQSRSLYEGLQARGVHAELVVYPGEGHGFSKVESLIDYLERMEAFLDGVGMDPSG